MGRASQGEELSFPGLEAPVYDIGDGLVRVFYDFEDEGQLADSIAGGPNPPNSFSIVNGALFVESSKQDLADDSEPDLKVVELSEHLRMTRLELEWCESGIAGTECDSRYSCPGLSTAKTSGASVGAPSNGKHTLLAEPPPAPSLLACGAWSSITTLRPAQAAKEHRQNRLTGRPSAINASVPARRRATGAHDPLVGPLDSEQER